MSQDINSCVSWGGNIFRINPFEQGCALLRPFVIQVATMTGSKKMTTTKTMLKTMATVTVDVDGWAEHDDGGGSEGSTRSISMSDRRGVQAVAGMVSDMVDD